MRCDQLKSREFIALLVSGGAWLIPPRARQAAMR
jgi:hypothetical protein